MGSMSIWLNQIEKLSREKAAYMGMPFYDNLARAANLERPLRFDDLQVLGAQNFAHEAVGNSMFVPNIGCVLMAALACVERTCEGGSLSERPPV